MNRLRACRAAATVTLAFTATWLPAAERYLEYTGVAVAHRTDRFAYGEHHFLTYRDERLAERVVLYTCRDGTPFARKTVEYVQPAAPNFLLEDFAQGMREGVRGVQGQRVMFFRGRQGEEERSAPLPVIEDLVIDAGFDHFVTANWQTLVGTGRAPMHFLVPSRRDYMNFEVLHLRRDTVAGIDSEVFRLKLSGVLGLLLPGIDVTYSRDAHTLLRYEGLADLRDARGDNISADISFDPASRQTVRPDAARLARESALRRCGEP